ncbi:hypothetical protein ASD62_09880 [Phycicoccus sp. Root563]|uniref:hypothetical protein n=1 Tax=Phycicoccus sp. Root563 TaxID=1736562 RepID=UPI0007029576|nr:hypothetical protein [Phycicoccus sp. Root563]KQZ89568.1 hypothetical protein ASD62_09880 [Phycicoccus sp. Root563]
MSERDDAVAGTSGPTTDEGRLTQARKVIRGGLPEQGNGNAVYAAYVAVIASLVYGVPASRAFFKFVDPQWLSRHLTGVQGVLVVGGIVVGALLLGYRLGSVRGPVVPDLPYLDHVASSALDRAVVLRRWWRISLAGCLVLGLLTGAVVGTGMVSAGIAPVVVLLPTTLGGLVVGLALGGAWLWGQVRSWPTGDRGPATVLRGRRSLRALHHVGLRTQSARAVTMGGAVLAGDLRAARLDVAAPSTRLRRTRLRARGRVTVVAERDLLGLRRSPGTFVVGLVLSAAGCWALAHSTTPGVPNIVAFAGVLAAYLGYGAWSEGMRLQGDNAGTPALIGLPFGEEALAHLITPSAMFAAVAVVCGVVVETTSSAGPAAIFWPVAMTALVAGTHLMAAFRGLPPVTLFSPGSAVISVGFWYSRPLLLALIGGVAATALLTRSSLTNAFMVLVLASYAAVMFGRRRVRLLDEAHRA